ncbi:MAG: dephospho-CoA kinase [Bacillales bacterium]|jgi:dephospho-CoA kinase|nr:dephospho-CoA kinase [Bacillales bacterium]
MIYGLTGGIATGKSTVSEILIEKGFTVIDADKIAREVVEPNTEAFKEIVSTFGVKILDEHGTLDRKKLGNFVFNNKIHLAKLNYITHPRIKEVIKTRITECSQKDIKTIFLDIPLLFEGDWHQFTEKNIVVYTSPEIQIERLMKRNNFTYEEALMRINAQMPIDEKKKLADIVIYNNGSIEDLYISIDELISNIS